LSTSVHVLGKYFKIFETLRKMISKKAGGCNSDTMEININPLIKIVISTHENYFSMKISLRKINSGKIYLKSKVLHMIKTFKLLFTFNQQFSILFVTNQVIFVNNKYRMLVYTHVLNG
jgi:hypothetical protein